METAKPLANMTRLPVHGTSAFRERDVVVMEGLTFEDAAQQHPEQYAALLRRDFEYVLTGGESYRQLLDRARQKLDDIIEENRGGKIAVFFFFQAEDGIRFKLVTGVQTCALPIWAMLPIRSNTSIIFGLLLSTFWNDRRPYSSARSAATSSWRARSFIARSTRMQRCCGSAGLVRSEERRVGKE